MRCTLAEADSCSNRALFGECVDTGAGRVEANLGLHYTVRESCPISGLHRPPLERIPMQINRARFLKNMEEMAAVGLLPEDAGGGRDRRPFSSADRAARELFRRLAAAAGLSVHLDAAANLSARLACGPPWQRPARARASRWRTRSRW